MISNINGNEVQTSAEALLSADVDQILTINIINTYPNDNASQPTEIPMLKLNSPNTTGIPVLEIVRKLEDEKLLNRNDRAAFKNAFDDVHKRDKILKALRDVELGTNKRFAVRRLRAIIHQNGSGELSSKAANTQTLLAFQEMKKELSTNNFGLLQENELTIGIPDQDDHHNASTSNHDGVDEEDESKSPIKNPKLAISKVVGDNPLYADTGMQTLYSKIGQRLKEFFLEYPVSKMGSRKFGVIVGQGSFNPLTRMHMRAYFIAKQELESRAGFIILGSLLSPAHGVTVRERYRTNHMSEIIPSPHRLAMAQLMVQDSKWLTVDPWEITRRRTMDYLALLDHVAETIKLQFIDVDIRIIYLCKPSIIPKLSPDSFRNKSYHCVTVCRAPESDNLRNSIGSKWNSIIHIVEDNAILDASMDVVTSRGVREKIQHGEAIDTLVGDTVNNYAMIHRLGPKMNGAEEWSEEDKAMPTINSRNQLMNYDRRSISALLSATSSPSSHSPNSKVSLVVTNTSTAQLVNSNVQQLLQLDHASLPAINTQRPTRNIINNTTSPSTSKSSVLPTLHHCTSMIAKAHVTSIPVSIPLVSVDTTKTPQHDIVDVGASSSEVTGISSLLHSPSQKITSPSKSFVNKQVEENINKSGKMKMLSPKSSSKLPVLVQDIIPSPAVEDDNAMVAVSAKMKMVSSSSLSMKTCSGAGSSISPSIKNHIIPHLQSR